MNTRISRLCEAAVNAVVPGKTLASKQSEVDAMAQTIENAIAALQYKEADYTKVDAAIGKANALKKDDLQRFFRCGDCNQFGGSREDSWPNRQRWMPWRRLSRMLWAPLLYKDADYTKVDAAIAKANALKKDEYKDFTAVEAAVNAVVRDKNITEQSEVDAMAKAIEDAIAALQIQGCWQDHTCAPTATATPAPAVAATY